MTSLSQYARLGPPLFVDHVSGPPVMRPEISRQCGGLRIACNAAYLMDAINAFTSDEVALEMGDELSPIKVCAQAESTVTVCMPMRA